MLCDLMHQRDLSRADVARFADMSAKDVDDLCEANRSIPLADIHAIANALGLSEQVRHAFHLAAQLSNCPVLIQFLFIEMTNDPFTMIFLGIQDAASILAHYWEKPHD